MKNEIIIYQADSHSERIEVTLENETVWLSQQQMALLFNQSKQNISLHINNCFKEKELDRNSTVKDSLIVQMEGNREVKRSRILWSHHARTLERRKFTGQVISRNEDWPALSDQALITGRASIRFSAVPQPLPGTAWANPKPFLYELSPQYD